METTSQLTNSIWKQYKLSSSDKVSEFSGDKSIKHLPTVTTQMFGSRKAGDSGPQNSDPTATPAFKQ